jgi:peptidoglycan/LPS O-acetylase OafA/YrhL
VRRETSIYLNAVRFLAALTVFLGHAAGQRFTAGFLWPLSYYMDVAVIIFFVLSGYVIAYVTDNRERTLDSYAINRLARILSVAVPALVLTLVLDTAGQHLRPALYSADWGFSADHVWLQYLAALTFTNELWWNHLSPGSMLPYWSLGYEVWYYAIFGAFCFVRGWSRYVLPALLCLIAGPKILALFPIWIGGFALYHVSRSRSLPRPLAIALFAGTCAIPLVLMALTLRTGFELHATLPARYATAIVFALNIIAVQGITGPFGSLLRALERPIDWLAGMTFSLYLFHLPVAQFLTSIMPWAPRQVGARLVIVAGTFLIVALLSMATERQKNVWRNGIARLFDKFRLKDRTLRPVAPS